MIAEKKSQANKGLGAGLLLAIGAGIVSGSVSAELGGLLYLVAAGAWVWGCFKYAEAKGYHPAFGLLGLATLLGLIVLAVLPDKHKEG